MMNRLCLRAAVHRAIGAAFALGLSASLCAAQERGGDPQRPAGDAGLRPPALALDLAGAFLVHQIAQGGTFCDGFVTCEDGGLAPAGMVAFQAGNGRLAVSIEFTSTRQVSSARSHPLLDHQVAFRATRGSLLAGYRIRTSGRLSYALLGGMSETVGDAAGEFQIKQTLLPNGGGFRIDDRDWALGVTGGADVRVALQSKLTLVVPVRVTWTVEGRRPESWPQPFDIQVGAGLAVRLHQRR